MHTTESTSASFPPVINVLQLAELIHKTPQSILADRSRAPHRLPPSCNPPGTKSPLWLLEDVIGWLRQHREQPVAAPAATATTAPRRGRGRPTKAEALARAQAQEVSEQ